MQCNFVKQKPHWWQQIPSLQIKTGRVHFTKQSKYFFEAKGSLL
jgi:hypothetical protein